MKEAALTYLRTLREDRGLSQEDIGRDAGVKGKQVYRWERGESEIPSSGLMAFLKAVQGSLAQFQALFEDEHATAEDGALAARKWLSQAAIDYIHEQADAIPAEQLQAALQAVDMYMDLQQRNKAGEWFKFGRFLKGGKH